MVLARFGALMAQAMHAAAGQDIDAFVAQRAALRAGVLVWVRMTAPCGTACVCARLTTWPADCLVAPDPIATATSRLINALTEPADG